MHENTETAEEETEKPPLYAYVFPALLLTAGLAGVWLFSTWWAKLLSGFVILAGLNGSVNLANAERKAHQAGLVKNTRRPALLFLYAAAVIIAALAGAWLA